MKEITECNLCGCSRFGEVYPRFNIVRCAECGLLFASTQPDSQPYDESYYTEPLEPGGIPYIENRGGLERFFEKRLRIIERHTRPGKLLEVGSALGFFLNVAKKRGWDVVGVEVSEFAVQYAREKFGHSVLKGYIEELDLPQESFDLVVARDVIEHTPDPSALLSRCHRLLRKGGLLALSTQNFSCSASRIAKEKWIHLRPGEHLYHFTPQTLLSILEKTHFKTIELDSRYIAPSVRRAYETATNFSQRMYLVWSAILEGDIVFFPPGSLPRKPLRAMAVVFSFVVRPFIPHDRNDILEVIARKR